MYIYTKDPKDKSKKKSIPYSTSPPQHIDELDGQGRGVVARDEPLGMAPFNESSARTEKLPRCPLARRLNNSWIMALESRPPATKRRGKTA
jgi:hypothetical protein